MRPPPPVLNRSSNRPTRSGAPAIVEGKPDTYEGEFGAGMRHGMGKYVFGNPDAKGAYYEGSFKATDIQVCAQCQSVMGERSRQTFRK